MRDIRGVWSCAANVDAHERVEAERRERAARESEHEAQRGKHPGRRSIAFVAHRPDYRHIIEPQVFPLRVLNKAFCTMYIYS